MISLLFLAAVVMYWVSIACTEGWKWRMDLHKPDNHMLVTFNNYHIWRSFNTASVMVAIVSAVLLGQTVPHTVALLACAMLAGWPLYERTMSFVERDSFLAARGETWHLVGASNIQRVPVLMDFALSALGAIGYTALTLLW